MGGIIVATFTVLKKFGHREETTFNEMRITRLNSSGDIVQAAISADGKWIAYTRAQNGKSSIWVRQVQQAARPGASSHAKRYYWTHVQP